MTTERLVRILCAIAAGVVAVLVLLGVFDAEDVDKALAVGVLLVAVGLVVP